LLISPSVKTKCVNITVFDINVEISELPPLIPQIDEDEDETQSSVAETQTASSSVVETQTASSSVNETLSLPSHSHNGKFIFD